MGRSAAALLFLLALQAPDRAGQSPSATDSGSVVFSVSQTLIQVDAEVTDRNGRHVTDLKSNDFEVLLNHKPQQITNLSYIHLDLPDINKPALAGDGLLPSFVIRPQDVHRSTVLLVDDLGLSFQSIYYVKRTLHEFINRNMRPGDLFALWETGRYNSVFQELTSDKHVLDAAIESIRWNPNSTGLLSAFDEEHQHQGQGARSFDGEGGSHSPSAAGNIGAEFPGTRDEQLYLKANLAASVFSTMNQLVDELKQVGGRKAIVLFSDGIDIAGVPDVNGVTDSGNPYGQESMKSERELIDKANRSGTVFYAIHMKGLEYRLPGRSTSLFNGQAGLQELTGPTGGFAVVNSNGFLDALERIEADQKGYYLIAFKAPPGIDTSYSASLPFLPLQIRVKRSGLVIRSRRGFWGETDEAANLHRSPDQQMREALTSLFNRSDLAIRLTAFYARTSEGKAAVRNLIYLSANDLKFTNGANEKHKALLNIMITASAPGLKQLANLSRRIDIDVNDDQLQRLLREGVLLVLDIPVARPGAYQVRASVEEDASKRIGSAGQYLDIPDLKKRHLALTTPLIDDASAPPRDRFRDASAALREFHAGSELTFVSVIETDKDTGTEHLDGSVTLFRDGQALVNSAIPVVPVQGESVHALRGEVKLNDALPPGQYYLKATATEHQGTHSRSTAAWIDFEVLPPDHPLH